MSAPLAYFINSHGPAAQPVMILGWVFTGLCVAVTLIVIAMLVFALAKTRERKNLYDSKPGDMELIYWGTGLSTLCLFGMAIYALDVLNLTSKPPSAPVLTINITGYDWWWKAVYENAAGVPLLTTANEIHIPAGVPIRLRLATADVIHAFWVPQLAGKTQMIPGQVNQQWLQADQPGIYRGQCTQFCGLQHAHMGFAIVAQTPADFQAWEDKQRTTPVAPPSSMAARGKTLFMAQCSGCHAVRGTEADGDDGPDLTHVASRRMLGAEILPNNPQTLIDWVQHVQEIKPGARMPDMPLTAAHASDLSAYLESLQ